MFRGMDDENASSLSVQNLSDQSRNRTRQRGPPFETAAMADWRISWWAHRGKVV